MCNACGAYMSLISPAILGLQCSVNLENPCARFRVTGEGAGAEVLTSAAPPIDEYVRAPVHRLFLCLVVNTRARTLFATDANARMDAAPGSVGVIVRPAT